MADEFLDFTLFAPVKSTTDLRIDYPELAEVEEFRKLPTAAHVKFAYYYGCRKSEHNRCEPSRRLQNSLRDSGLDKILQSAEMAEYKNRHFDALMTAAVAKMERYRPSERLQAKLAQLKMFNQIMQMIDMAQNELDNGMTNDEGDIVPIDVDARKQLVDFISSANKQIPQLVETLEASWGIKMVEVAESKKESKKKFFDEVMEVEPELKNL